MSKPKVTNVVHIPYIKYDQYITEKYSIPAVRPKHSDGYDKEVNYYDTWIVDSHMFRGNDSTKSFHNQFMEETIPQELRSIFDFLPSKILDVIFNGNGDKKANEAILKISEKEWILAYKSLLVNSQAVLDALGKDNEYYFGYVIAGLYESSVLSTYKIKDYYKNNYHTYFWFFSW